MSSRWGKRKNSLRGSQNKFLAHHRPSHLDDILRMTLQYRGRRDHAARFLCSSLPKDITLRISRMMLLFLFLLFLFFFLERYHHRNHPSTPFKAFKKNGPPARMPKTADSATNVVSSLPTSPCSSSSPPVVASISISSCSPPQEDAGDPCGASWKYKHCRCIERRVREHPLRYWY